MTQEFDSAKRLQTLVDRLEPEILNEKQSEILSDDEERELRGSMQLILAASAARANLDAPSAAAGAVPRHRRAPRKSAMLRLAELRSLLMPTENNFAPFAAAFEGEERQADRLRFLIGEMERVISEKQKGS